MSSASDSPEEGDIDDAALFGDDSGSDDSAVSDGAITEDKVETTTPAAAVGAVVGPEPHRAVGEHPAIIFCDECGTMMKPEVFVTTTYS